MKGSDLLSIWDAPDNTRLTPKQVSLRLPIHIAARISALCEMYPLKTKTEIMGDLLGMALDQVQTSFPKIKGRQISEDIDDRGVVKEYVDTGPSNQFRLLANKHYAELEMELGNTNPSPLFPHKFTFVEEER